MNVPSDKVTAPARAPRSPEDLRERVLDSALRSFAERGFHGTTVPEIAAEARVGVGSIYRHFASKERLVNEVFRRAKGELRDALLLGLDPSRGAAATFRDVWARLVRFQRERGLAFRFLETQDHAPYLDEESLALERSLLAPLHAATCALRPAPAPDEVPADVLIALVWGAFVGLSKAERLGYLTLDDAMYARAGEACFRALALPGVEAPPTIAATPVAHDTPKKPKKPKKPKTPKTPKTSKTPKTPTKAPPGGP
jgi:TetR/AcrR family transcriptional regulator, repressor of fatR-cypB operon